ncbi:MAG: nucleotidyltransferase domain-containing protein [Patescibacteria group bacterium]
MSPKKTICQPLRVITDKLLEHKVTIRQYGIRRIGVYGSTVRNEAKETSDIDLLVDFTPHKKPIVISGTAVNILRKCLVARLI